MHVLSELRNPDFEVPDRSRALRALQMSRVIRENNTTKAWAVVKAMIEKVIEEHFSAQRSTEASQTSSNTTPRANQNLSSFAQTVPRYDPVSPKKAEQPNQAPPTDYGQFSFSNMPSETPLHTVDIDFDWVRSTFSLHYTYMLTMHRDFGATRSISQPLWNRRYSTIQCNTTRLSTIFRDTLTLDVHTNHLSDP